MITGQAASMGIYKSLEQRANLPASMTFETNGTQKLTEPFKQWIKDIPEEIFFSVSPKLVGASRREWEELENTVRKFREAGIDWPVWIMPTGAREEEQTTTAGQVAEEAFKRGYNVSARVHVYLFGNAIGT